MRHLDLADLQVVGAFVLDSPMMVRYWGLLESALARPRTTVFGENAYPGILLLHKNGIDVAFEEDDAYDLVITVAERRLDVPEIAEKLRRWAQ